MKRFSNSSVVFCYGCAVVLVMAFVSAVYSDDSDAPRVVDDSAAATEKTTVPSLADRIQIVKDYLKTEGYVPKEISNCVLTFKNEGSVYIVFLSETDGGYFRVVYPNFYKVDLNKKLAKLYEVEFKVGDSLKVVRVTHDDEGSISASVELFCSDTDEFVRVLIRSVSACRLAAQSFTEQAEKNDLKK